MGKRVNHCYQDKVIWITGASSGIGEALARKFAGLGATLVLTSRNKAKLEALRRSLPDSDKHRVAVADLTRLENLPPLVDRLWEETGGIAILINNAGLSQRSLALETRMSVESQIMDLDFWAPVHLSKLLAPRMVKKGEGQIINIASMTAKIGSPGRSIYTAAKHALLGYMDCLRAELSDKGVRVINVCPGFVKTNISRNALKGDASPFAKLDEEIKNGMSTEVFVEKLLKKLPKKDEIIIADGLPLLGYWVYKISPSIYQKVLEKVYQKHTWQQSAQDSSQR